MELRGQSAAEPRVFDVFHQRYNVPACFALTCYSCLMRQKICLVSTTNTTPVAVCVCVCVCVCV